MLNESCGCRLCGESATALRSQGRRRTWRKGASEPIPGCGVGDGESGVALISDSTTPPAPTSGSTNSGPAMTASDPGPSCVEDRVPVVPMVPGGDRQDFSSRTRLLTSTSSSSLLLLSSSSSSSPLAVGAIGRGCGGMTTAATATTATSTTTTTTNNNNRTWFPWRRTSTTDVIHATFLAATGGGGGGPLARFPLVSLLLVLLVSSVIPPLADACSSRSTPTPRPATPSATPIRPNVTFQTYACPPAYAAWYCLNGATCFTVKIGESLLYNCECADGYMGQRCEYKDLDGTYLPTREKVTLETASIAGGATVAVIFVVIVCFLCWIYLNRKGSEKKQVGASSSSSSSSCHRRIGIGMGMRGGVDEVDALESGEDASFQPFARYGLPRHKSTFHLIPGTFKYSMHPSHQEMQNGQEDAGPGLHRLRPQPQPQPQPQADKKRVRGESSTLPS